jgi:ribosomal protein S18 acetylase RimI-like enzyme/predicted N-acetyltransferase YhbS
MTKEEGWVPSRYSAEDAQDCLQLLRRTSGDAETASPAYQEWLYQRSPAGPAIATLARETETGRLIGQVATIPTRVRLSGKERLASLSLDPVIDPAYQNRGVLAGLLKDVCALSAEEGIAFTYGFPDQPSFSTFVNKAGFANTGSVPLLVRPLNPERLAMKTTHSLVPGKAASVARRVWRTPTSAPRQEAVPGLEIRDVDSFDSSFVLFWDRVQHRFPVMVVRDPAYLNWRFAGAPTRKYTTFVAKSEDEIRGFIVLRAAPLGQFSAGLIVELVVEASAEGRAAGRLLIDKAHSYFEDQDLDVLASLALRHTDEFRLLRSRGFWVAPKFLEPRPFRLVVRCHDEERSASRLAYDLSNWLVTMGDYEAE